MREREMRRRVERFIQSRLRNMLMPATLGLGLAVGGCSSSALNAQDGSSAVGKNDSSSALVESDSGSVKSDSGSVKNDSGSVLPIPSPDAATADGANTKKDAGFAPRKDAFVADGQGGEDVRPSDAGSAVDGGSPADAQAALDAQAVDSAKQDVGGIGVKYLAQFPDAGRDLPPIVPPYTALQPDAGSVVLYMAPQPLYMALMTPDARS